MSDLIEREAGFDALVNKGQASTRYKLSESWELNSQEIREALNAVPPAQPKQRTGKWTLGFDNRYMEKYYYCSCCGCRKYEEHEPLDYFCSNCGAKMERITDA